MANRKQTVTDLKNVLGQGAKTTNFAVDIPVPIILKGVAAVNSLLNKIPVVNKIISYTGNVGTSDLPTQQIKTLAKSSTIPGKRINTVDVWDRGHKYIIRDVADFDHRWSVTFYNTSNLGLREIFETWMYELDRFDSAILRTPFLTNNMGVGTPKFMANLNPGYMVDMVISQLDCKGNESAKFEMTGAFPVELSEVTVDATQVNQISEFTVTFAYTNWSRVQADPVSVKDPFLSSVIPSPSNFLRNIF